MNMPASQQIVCRIENMFCGNDSGFGIDSFHVTQEDILQHVLVEHLWMLVNGFTSDGEDGTGLEIDTGGP